MAVKPATDSISKNNIVFHKTYVDDLSDNIVSSVFRNYHRKSSDLTESNIISNNTIKPPKPRNPEADHPSTMNRCTLTNTYINTGFLIPYLSFSFDPPSVIEIYYK